MSNPKLIVLSEQLRGQVFELTGDTYSIGRVEERDICIVDATVSTHHADLVRNDDGLYTVKDLGSTNGSRVNGMRIEEQMLVNSDILQIGSIEMLFDCDDKSPTSVFGKDASSKTQINLNDTIKLESLSNKDPYNKGGILL